MSAPSASQSIELEPLWKPSNSNKTNTYALLEFINKKFNLREFDRLNNYEDLYGFSISRRSDFWKTTWDFTGVIGNRDASDVHPEAPAVIEERTPADNPAWFPGAEVNWAENMLGFGRDEPVKDRLALLQVGMSIPISQRLTSSSPALRNG
jgi:acetoacetyl-CoA synthetase